MTRHDLERDIPERLRELDAAASEPAWDAMEQRLRGNEIVLVAVHGVLRVSLKVATSPDVFSPTPSTTPQAKNAAVEGAELGMR